jgi:type I restriction enzyme S subunit
VVSTEFPVFEIRQDLVYSEVLDTFFRNPAVWPELAGASTGTNVRRRRLNPEDFLSFCIPLPTRDTQERLRKVRAELSVMSKIQKETSADLDAMLPAILDNAFCGDL